MAIPAIKTAQHGTELCWSAQEFGRYDSALEKHAKSHSFWDPRRGAPQTCSVQHERFLAPELFFRPDFISSDYTTPLPQVRKLGPSPVKRRRLPLLWG